GVALVERCPTAALSGAARRSRLGTPGLFTVPRRTAARAVAEAEPALPALGGSHRLRRSNRGPVAASPRRAAAPLRDPDPLACPLPCWRRDQTVHFALESPTCSREKGPSTRSSSSRINCMSQHPRICRT